MDFIYKIFNKYFKQYKVNVLNKIGSLIRVTDEDILDVCLTELNDIFEIIAWRKNKKIDIPQYNKFPNSDQFNNLLKNIDIDLDKLFNASKIIVQDAQNVVNYNSTERESITYLLATAQAQVYSAYISSRKGITGTTIIKEEFLDVDKTNLLSDSSVNDDIDTNLKRLSLKSLTAKPITDNSTVVTDLVDCAQYNAQDESLNLYPNNVDLVPGSFWKVKSSVHHHGKRHDPSYKDNLITRKPSAKGARSMATGAMSLSGGSTFGRGYSSSSEIDSCQFESVLTIDIKGDLEKVI